MQKKIIAAVAGLVLGGGIAIPTQAELFDRGGGLIYDSDQNITWLQDPFGAGGRMSWGQANELLATFSYYDSVRDTNLTGWRLPTALNPDFNVAPCWGYRGEPSLEGPSFPACTEANTESELGHLFYALTALGNAAHHLTNTGDFENVGDVYNVPCGGNYYWTGTVFGSTSHWVFHYDSPYDYSGAACATAGLQDGHDDSASGRVWFVRNGDVAPVYECVGFDAPMASGPVTVRKQRTLPLKAELVDDAGVPITDTDVTAPPVLQVTYTSSTGGDPEDVTDEALPAGQGTIGNAFVFSNGEWRYNLETANYSAAGTYVIKMVTGDSSEYAIDSESVCTATFIIGQ